MLVVMMLLSFYNLMIAKSRTHTQKDVSAWKNILWILSFFVILLTLSFREGWKLNSSVFPIGLPRCLYHVYRRVHRGNPFRLLHLWAALGTVRSNRDQSNVRGWHEGNVWPPCVSPRQHVRCLRPWLVVLATTNPSMHFNQLLRTNVHYKIDKEIKRVPRGTFWRGS